MPADSPFARLIELLGDAGERWCRCGPSNGPRVCILVGLSQVCYSSDEYHDATLVLSTLAYKWVGYGCIAHLNDRVLGPHNNFSGVLRFLIAAHKEWLAKYQAPFGKGLASRLHLFRGEIE